MNVNIDRTSISSAPRANLAVFTVASSGTPETTLTKVADALETLALDGSPTWYTFTFAQPVQFQASQTYMLGVDRRGGCCHCTVFDRGWYLWGLQRLALWSQIQLKVEPGLKKIASWIKVNRVFLSIVINI